MAESDNATLAEALRYLARGWSVIPVDSRRKGGAPFAWREFQGRLPTEDEVRRWWVEYPAHGVAVIMGAVSGLVALDLDRHGEVDGVGAAASLFGWEPEGPMVTTGGGGLHAYYKHPGFRVKNMTGQGSLAPGVELKGDGGFLYAPPSVHASGTPYAWTIDPEDEELSPLPAWVLSELRGQQAPEALDPDTLAAADPLTLVRLQGITEGGRNDAASRLAGSYFAQGFDAGQVMDALVGWNQRNSPPLSPAELSKVVASIGQREDLRRGGVMEPTALVDHGKQQAVLQVVSEKFGVQIDSIWWVTGTEPKMRFVCGSSELTLLAELARDQRTWNKKMFAATGTVPRLIGPKDQNGWDFYLQMMSDLARHNTVEAGEEATTRGQTRAWLSAYLELHKPAQSGDEARTSNEPIVHKGLVHVHLPSLRKYIRHTYDERISSRDFAQRLRSWGFESQTVHITYGQGRHRTTRTMWGIPSGFLQAATLNVEVPF